MESVEDSDLSDYEAAHLLVELAVDWVSTGAAVDVSQLASAVTDSFAKGDNRVKTAIETGFLEHAFEHKPLVAYFEHWKDQPEMNAAYFEAIKWAAEHPRDDDSEIR